MRNVLLSVFIVHFLLIFNGGFSSPSKYEGKIIRKIDFIGITNVDPDDLLIELEQTETDIGFPLKASEMRKAIKLIFSKGQFENVIAEVDEYRDGVQIRFICKERPSVSEIEFKGVEELTEVDLEGVILVKEGEVLRKNFVEDSVKLIKKKYKESGLFNANVDYKLIKNEKENTVRLVFIIDEGEDIKVGKVSILGPKIIKPDKLLGVMETKEKWWFAEGTFDRDIYEQDKAKIIAYYKERGYLDAQIIEDSVEYEWQDPEKKEERSIFITIKISEGEKYYFDKYTIEGNIVFDTESLESKFQQKEAGKEFNDTFFQMDRQSISFTYASKGYIFARVIPQKTIEEREIEEDGEIIKRKFVKIDFRIEEGSQAYIENIIIKGNSKTKDKVIRREILAKEGELFNSAKVQISREKIFNLGYFKEVNFDIRPGSKEGLMNLIVDVEEQSSGTLSLGGGYGTNSGFSIFADIAENNLFGNGQRIGLRFQYGPESTSVTLSFNEPWLLDYPIGFNASVFYELYTRNTNSMFSNTNEYAEYQKQSFGYSLGLSYRFWYYYGIGAIWRHAFKSILNPSGNSPDDLFIEEALGIQESRTTTLYIYRDTKDNYLNPTKGWRAEMSVGFTGGYIIRGDDHYITYSPELFYYYTPFHLPFLKTHPCVIELRANGKFLMPPLSRNRVQDMQPREENPWLETEDMLYLGGPETLRGWEPSYYENSFPESWRRRLYHRITYGAELRIPVHPQMFWLALFFDAGSLWTDSFWEQTRDESDREIFAQDKADHKLYNISDFFDADKMDYFKYSWGFGFKVQIPMMPLRFWFARKVKWVGKDEGFFKEISKNFNFQFAIGDYRF